MFYAFDTGLGQVVNLADPGHNFFPLHQWGALGGATNPNSYKNPNIGGTYAGSPPYPASVLGPPAIATPYGACFNWPGAAADSEPNPGLISDVRDNPTEDNIRAACDLYSAPVGQGWSVASSHVQTGACTKGAIFGRPSCAVEGGPLYVCWLSSNGTNAIDSTNREILFGWDNGALGNTIVSSVNPALGTWHTSVGTAHCDTAGSPGASTCRLYVDGVLQGTTTGQVVVDSFGGDFRFSGDANSDNDESQFMMGTIWHATANHNFSTFCGYVYWGAFWNRVLSPAEALQLYLDPYCFLLPAVGARMAL